MEYLFQLLPMKSNQKHIQDIRFEGDTIIIQGKINQVKYALADLSDKLLQATQKQRETFQISPTGLGVHWLLLDEDLSFPNL